MDFYVPCWLNTFLCKKWQSLNVSCTMTLRRALFSILLNGLCWNSYFISWIHLSLPPKESALLKRQHWTKWCCSSVCWKEIWRKWGKTQTSAMFTLTFTIFLSIYPPMTNWQPRKGQRWYFSYTIRPLLPRKKEKKTSPRWKKTQPGNKWAIF